ncbi:DUF2064 domain-containing protein [Marivirga sp.]|uniref:DUF2064 domain-containing protein n=1 Tax=Marivirga sp. TaxID=2018662 RepID=UPI002D7EA7A9|nr:DUF2064 domain-containing protein [Marivirga sp.]HET8858389.1 DUF2064 domain-containing protein [Marivirga sp.]
MKKQFNIALIFFSRTKADEATTKQWFSGHSKNKEFAQLLIERANQEISYSGLPVYHFDERNQKGDSFGERLANAYQEVFNLGYDQVISVGNDCPDLKNINWERITQELASGKSVLGPDLRGGAYLIGIQKSSFDKTKFENLSWQHNKLFSELTQFCLKTSLISKLQKYRDINSLYDIRILATVKNSGDNFFKILSRFLKPAKPFIIAFRSAYHDFNIFKDSPLRAPPF